MATAVKPVTYENGFREPTSGTPWIKEYQPGEEMPSYVVPPSVDLLSSTVHNHLGENVQRVWPTLADGTNSPHGVPEWYKKEKEVDVLICGAGPSGLEVALSLIRQGVSFHKAPGPLLAGRADGVQPRFLETLHQWGLAEEVHEEGPLIERTAVYRDGKKVLFGRSHQSDSRYRGLHIITQGQVERIFIRDLYRHHKLVERLTTVKDFVVEDKGEYPVKVNLANEKTGEEEEIRAKFLVGSDGAGSRIRKSMNISFDGVSTDIYWGIMDCVFETDYPHAWMFGLVINSKHGGCVIIPREDGYIRLYTQLDTSATGELARSRQQSDPTFAEAGGKVDVHSITPDEVLAQANRIFAPYKLKFGSTLSWFAIWKISERVAANYSYKNRVHLVGDAAHVHSVMGAFGLNASILDASNLAWKLGFCANNQASIHKLLPTYENERRRHAVRIIETSGVYLRFACNSTLPPVNLKGVGTDPREDELNRPEKPDPAAGEENEDIAFLKRFYAQNGPFLLGVDAAYGNNVLNPPRSTSPHPAVVKNGVRAPNPRVCFSQTKTGYLYDALAGPSKINIIVWGSDLEGPIRKRLVAFAKALADPVSFYNRFGGAERFNIVLVAKDTPLEAAPKLAKGSDLAPFREIGTVLYDDRAPDEDAHTCYGVDHAKGAAVVVRPDMWTGISAFPNEVDKLAEYFAGFLIETGGVPIQENANEEVFATTSSWRT
ncbi:putative Phenol 2-monooxygenase [Tuber indicum]|nr:putative Phenol 2-monooxygenase [Tuber indicum]